MPTLTNLESQFPQETGCPALPLLQGERLGHPESLLFPHIPPRESRMAGAPHVCISSEGREQKKGSRGPSSTPVSTRGQREPRGRWEGRGAGLTCRTSVLRVTRSTGL